MPQKKWKTALIWSTVATVVIAGLELFVRMSSGTKAADALAQVAWWVVVWPAIFGAIWLITSWRELTKQSQMKAVERQARRAASSPVAPADVVCPKCGFANPSVAIRCVHCDFEFRPLEVVHVAELLPGARESLPSVLYVVAVVVSFVIGGAAVAVIGLVDQDLLQENWILIGGFLFGAGVSLLGFFALIRLWAIRRSRSR